MNDTIRATVEQNIVLRWVSEADLPELYNALAEIGLNEPGAGTIADVTACPGTDTCKLGIASSRGLAAELRTHLAEKGVEMDAAVEGLRIKISGCFNSCGQHHVADLGFYGISRKVSGYTVPHFSGGTRRPVDRQRRIVRIGDGRGPLQADPRRGGANQPELY